MAVKPVEPVRSGEGARDIVGVGALNLDLIANASALRGTPVLERITRQAGIDPPLTPCTERLVDEPTVRAALACVDGVPLTPVPGGSAFNTVHALARLDAGLRLGYVGVAGRSPVAGLSATGTLDELGVDRRMVRTVNGQLSGICLSVYERGERTLLTHAGANTGLAEYLSDRFEEVVEYLGGARVVHVTSFEDPDGGAELHRVLTEVRKRSPGTLVNLDPGHAWSADPPPAVLEIAALCDYLLVNQQELADLAPLLPGLRATVVVKRPDRVEVRRDGAVWASYAHVPLADGEVEDATGAGDVFAAGLLTGLTSAPDSGPDGPDEGPDGPGADGPGADGRAGAGVRLGMALARHKLRHVGSQGHGAFAGIARLHLGIPAGRTGGE